MIQFGNDKIKEIYHGSDKIKEVYHGNELVWSGSKPSYAILTDGTRIDFEIENTPIANLRTSSSSVVINGFSYTKTTIKEIYFGSSYSGVTEIGNYFLRECTSLLNITLTTKTPPNASGYGFLQSTNKVSSIYVPENSVNLYKTTSPWSSKSSIIKAI